MKPQTLQLMITDRLTDVQKTTYWTKDTHGYGLGVRCCNGIGNNFDFGWGGAAGAYLAIDIQNEISIYFACHLHSSPGQGVRSLLYRFIRAELFDNDDFENIKKEIANLYDYNLTY